MRDFIEITEDLARRRDIYHLVTTNRSLLELIDRALDRYMAEVLLEYTKCARVNGEQITITIGVKDEDA